MIYELHRRRNQVLAESGGASRLVRKGSPPAHLQVGYVFSGNDQMKRWLEILWGSLLMAYVMIRLIPFLILMRWERKQNEGRK
jgi:hypothetical protein